tara:strand:+ start:177 stop:857 length:681 start_codon:yes stop_codon:yes gene_type:complete
MVWFIPAAISAVLLLRGHRMITVVGGSIGGLAGFIASDLLFDAVPMLLQWELYVKIGLVVLGFAMVYSALLAVMRSVAGIGVYMAVSSFVFALNEQGYEIEQNHSNILGAGLAVGAFLLTWNMRRAMPLLASLIVGASLGVASFQLFYGATLSQIDPVRPDPLWLWILFICVGLLVQRIDIKKRRHLKEVKQGTVYDPKLSEEKHFREPKKKGLDKYMEAEPWHQK